MPDPWISDLHPKYVAMHRVNMAVIQTFFISARAGLMDGVPNLFGMVLFGFAGGEF